MADNSLDYYSAECPPPPFQECRYRRAERARQAWSWAISIGVTLAAVAIIGVAIWLGAYAGDAFDESKPRNVLPNAMRTTR